MNPVPGHPASGHTVLCIDTASPAFALALAVDGRAVRSLQRDSNQDHSRLLLGAIDETTGGDRVLDGIVVVRGPGSYAGLRVGIATAEGLALARRVPLAGVGTLEAVAHAAGQGAGTAIHPAGRAEWAVQSFADGRLTGTHTAVPEPALTGILFGEGAGAFGGTDVSPEARCRAALEIGLSLLADGSHGGVDAIYLREPHITRPTRPKSRTRRG
ncbi:MAG: tRNA (adenosine(37)-N6)-threonylcarbamoyltransferase complex dimerization subunit type 1 TsaB [Dehalococcoidia bacterium]